MPIKINLLAEEQAAEELRRKDPVKRSIYAGAGLAGLVVVWAVANWFGLMGYDKRLQALKADFAAIEAAAKEAEANRKRVSELESKLEMLKKLSASRPIWAPTLDVFQRSTVDQIEMTRLRVDQSYVVTPAFVPPRGSELKPKPATALQKVSLTIDAKDLNYRDQNYTKYKDMISNLPVFKESAYGPVNVALRQVSPPRDNPDGGQFITFSIECQYPDVVR